MRITLMVGSIIVLWAVEASPCSGPVCWSNQVPVPVPGSVIPANVPSIGFSRTWFSTSNLDGGTWVFAPTATSPILRPASADGGSLATASLDASVGVFVSPPAWTEGSEWVFELPTSDGQCQTSTSFAIGPAAAVPSSAAVVQELDSRWVPGTSSTCGTTPASQLVRFQMTPTPGMIPWLPLARWELEVDGRNASTAPFAALPPTGTSPEYPSGLIELLPLGIMRVECEPSSAWSVGPGLHAVRFLAVIEGFPSRIPSNTLMVQTSCTPPNGGGGCSSTPGLLCLIGLLTLRAGRRRSGRPAR
jgi:hypothetical protein